ncbi:MAG TPA: glutamate-5-semialdehyde dehydrogenase [Candidatus Polarisedimenticolia bacterium]|jgi:glutamate-5-semialdehyde dehydrogenase|nr:glutamate-5-semialdehyde dehydrogenase [Dongiaceae bacterium]HYV89479.1 glutamate-5-semialdehyde dehydrogenase [Candidatus Polarisedimenticolia bacterium]
MSDATIETRADQELQQSVRAIAEAARNAAGVLAEASADQRTRALQAAARHIRAHAKAIAEANGSDLSAAEKSGMSHAMLDRLHLNDARIEAMAKGVEVVANLPDPLGRILWETTRPNGMTISRISVPLGVIGIIYESRPNVTADAAALCLRAGNATILRGGSESRRSSAAILACFRQALKETGLPGAAVEVLPTADRRAVGVMLGLSGLIDVIVPRGGKGLIERVQQESRIPVLAHLDGLCHTYVDRAADPAMARAIVLNAKMRRTGVCGATETLLIDRACAAKLLPGIANDLIAAGCALRGDGEARKIDNRIAAANDADWDTEYLDAILSIAVVDGVEGALTHIARHGSHHTEAIVTDDAAAAEKFLRGVDAAILLVNASTQFADGGEFGMGAEIGIATGKLHARGPVGAEQLTSYKYIVRGTGQTRP